MARKYIFADESGNFDFSHGPGASRYFILTTVTADSCAFGDALVSLRRELAWDGKGLSSQFHASTDDQATRDCVFAALQGHAFRVDATILEKAKAQPHLRATEQTFYQYAWFYHLKYLARRVAGRQDNLLVVGASLGTKQRRQLFHKAIEDVVAQVAPTVNARTAFWSAESDPCLQVADYCSWAIQRKWERNDERSYTLIAERVRSTFEPFRNGATLYY